MLVPALVFAAASTASAAEPTWDPLRSPRADASSHLASNWNKFEENYHPTYVLDGNAATAWVEGVEGDGVGQWLALPLSRVAKARALQLRIRNGYQKSEVLLAANAAPKDVTIEVTDGDRVVATAKASLTRTMGWQTVAVPVTAGFDGVRIRVDSVTPGKTYHDTCLSDVLVDVDSDVPYEPAREAAKLAVAKHWIADRVAVARQFAAGGFTSPYASTRYTCTETDPPPAPADVDAKIGRVLGIRAIRDQLKAATTTGYRADPTRSFPKPDGAWDFDAVPHLLRTDTVGFLEAKTGRTDPPAPEEAIYWSGREWSVFRLDGPPTAPTSGFVQTHERFDERTTTIRDTDWTFVWSDGRLQALLATVTEDDDHAPAMEPGSNAPVIHGVHETLLVPSWTDDGRIRSWEGWSYGVRVDECGEPGGCKFSRQWICRGS
ncbi:MAG: hypothetical protein ABMB14_35055 [Myxococcota bacterium]